MREYTVSQKLPDWTRRNMPFVHLTLELKSSCGPCCLLWLLLMSLVAVLNELSVVTAVTA